jgi:hypothetical protein
VAAHQRRPRGAGSSRGAVPGARALSLAR